MQFSIELSIFVMKIMCVRIICGNKFDSVKLQLEDKDEITIIYRI